MKNYFDFHLRAKQLLPLWIIFYLVYLIPYFMLQGFLNSFKTGSQNPITSLYKLMHWPVAEGLQTATPKTPFWIVLLNIPLYLIMLIWMFYFIRLVLKNVSFKENFFQCNYQVNSYLGVVIKGFFLSIVTLGIYLPWFIRDLHRFFINNSSWKENYFNFKGTGEGLLIIFFATIILPVIFIMLAVIIVGISMGGMANYTSIIKYFPLFFPFLVILYMYYFYKWRVNMTYREYSIHWNTRFWPSMGKIVQAIFLTVITLGIYGPIAFLELYSYFAEKTEGRNFNGDVFKFGYELERKRDFLLMWGQVLLTILTFGIYYPWAFCKITQRVLRKSFLEK